MKINLDEVVETVKSIKEYEERMKALPFIVRDSDTELRPLDFLENFKEFEVDYDQDNPFFKYEFKATYKSMDFCTYISDDDMKELSAVYDLSEIFLLESQFVEYKGKKIRIREVTND